MHSKKHLGLTIVLLALSLTVVQCSYFFDEKKKENEIEYHQEVGSCIGRVNQTIGSYFSQQADREVSEGQLDEFSSCYQESLQSFITYTKSGRLESDDYSAENIELLIQRFHPEVRLDAERIRGYIQLKAFLIGGSKESISKNELRTLQRFLPMVAEGLKKLLPHRDTWLRRVPPARNHDGYIQFNQAFSALKEELGVILAELDQYRGRRQINIYEISEFFLKELFDDDYVSFLKYQTLIAKFKNFVIYEETDQLNRGNLTLFARQAALTYEALTRFDVFLKDESEGAIFGNFGKLVSFVTMVPSQLDHAETFRGVGLRALSDIYSAGEAILTYGVRSQPEQNIPMDRLRDVLLALEEAEIFNGRLTAGTLSYFIHNFSKKWLNPGGPEDSGMTMDKIHYIKGRLDKWVRRQQIVNSLFEENPEGTVSLLNFANQIPDQPEMQEWYEIFRAGQDNKEVNTHQWDAHNRVLYNSDITHFNYSELTVSNSISLLVEIFMKPFNVDESNPLRYKVTDQQAQEIYEVMRVLGVEMAFMDSRVDDSGLRAFGETNNFSTQKRSDDFLDFYEGYEYLSVAMNAGELADWIYDDFPRTSQCMTDIFDVHGREIIEADCFRNYLKDNFTRFFGHLSSITHFWQRADNAQRDEFLRSLEIASRAGLIRDKPYDLSEIRVTVSILHYVESIYFMFDGVNTNDLIDGTESTPGDSELRRAENHFRNLIADFLVNKKPEILQENDWLIRRYCGQEATQQEIVACVSPKIFIQLIRRGDLPLESGDVCGGASFFRALSEEVENTRFQETQAHPGNVVKVFAALAKITLESHRDRVQNFLVERRQELLDSLSSRETPDCREQPNQVFCRWGREIFCNETVFPDVYGFFRDNRRRFLVLPNYSENPASTAREVMAEIYEEFTDGPRSTQCAFPPVYADANEGFWANLVDDCVTGSEAGGPTIRERGNGVLEGISQGWQDLMDSF